MKYIALDAHKHYPLACVEEPTGKLVCEKRLGHRRGDVQQFLTQWTPGSPVAIETVGNWCWFY